MTFIEWLQAYWGFIVACVVAVTLIYLIISHFSYKWAKEEDDRWEEIVKMGYDVGDVSVFLNGIGNEPKDFLISGGLRKQYELFRDGKTSDFQKTAKAGKEANDAVSSGMTTGLVAGMAIGSAMQSGNE